MLLTLRGSTTSSNSYTRLLTLFIQSMHLLYYLIYKSLPAKSTSREWLPL